MFSSHMILSHTITTIILIGFLPSNSFARGGKQISVLDLQPYKVESSIDVEDGTGRKGKAFLTNVNNRVNAWFLLRLEWPGKKESVEIHHLENPDPEAQSVSLDSSFTKGLILRGPKGDMQCELWGKSGLKLQIAKVSKKPYAPLCDDRLFLRIKIQGFRTTKEWVVDFLRDHVWGGEKVTTFVKQTLYKDKYLLVSQESAENKPESTEKPQEIKAFRPRECALSGESCGTFLPPKHLGITVETNKEGNLEVGKWYPVKESQGVFLSMMVPKLLPRDIVKSFPKLVSNLDNVEQEALVYSIAFDMNLMEMGFKLGTDHPRVDWSERVLDKMRDNDLPGPDGIGDVAPFVMTGLTAPWMNKRLVATFTGGFKRSHGAFKWGDLALRNAGSHYGFIEQGTVFSKLQPGLATIIIYRDHSFTMKTWRDEDNTTLEKIVYARQNGVAIIDYDEQTKTSEPGKLVKNWGDGNWSGSQDSKLRALRAGVCLQENEKTRYLIYTYFSSVTPSAMARIFQGYGCKYAMHLDMNALEHTYLSFFRKTKDVVTIQHLVDGMEVLDKEIKDRIVPRFVGLPDNRDFFYILRR